MTEWKCKNFDIYKSNDISLNLTITLPNLPSLYFNNNPCQCSYISKDTSNFSIIAIKFTCWCYYYI